MSAVRARNHALVRIAGELSDPDAVLRAIAERRGRRRRAIHQPLVPPRTSTETAIAAVWCDVLQLRGIGVHDDYFELGGNSLQIVVIVSRLNRELGLDLDIGKMFAAPTVERLAAVIDRAREQTSTTLERPPLRRRAATDRFPVSYGQTMHYRAHRRDPQCTFNVVPLGFLLDGEVDRGALAAALGELVARHEVLRATFTGDGPHQSIQPAPDQIAPRALDLREHRGDRGEALAAARRFCAEPFDLARDLLLRALLVELGPRRTLLALNVHHIAFDGLSVPVLLRELGSLYRDRLGGAPRRPQPELQYADFADWEQRLLDGPVGAAQERFWRERLATCTPLRALRPRRGGRAVAIGERFGKAPGGVVLHEAAGGLFARVERLAREERASAFMVLLAGFFVALRAHCDEDRICLFSSYNRRDLPGAENLIGYFGNPLVQQGDLSGDPSFRQLTARVRRSVLEAWSNPDVPLSLRLGAAPALFSINFNFIPADAAPELAMPGLTAEQISLGGDDTVLDLVVWTRMPRGSRALYNRDVLPEPLVQSLIATYYEVIERALADPDLRVWQLIEA